MTIGEFARALVARYGGRFDAADARIISGDLRAGEFEVVAISIVETQAASRSEVDELDRLAAGFQDIDRQIADRVIVKQRDTLR